MRSFKLGLIINPFAGIGGTVALKGSDGAAIRQKALELGAQQKAMEKTKLAMQELLPLAKQLHIFTVAGDMGENICRQLGLAYTLVHTPTSGQTEATDTEQAATQMLQHKLDLLLFAGGDGTARNILDQIGDSITALGIPAGCKIHSGVYAITPKSAGRVVAMLVRGEIVSLQEAEVKDIDEEKFRQGRVQARLYGEMKIPTELRYIQAVKSGGKESEELVLADIAAHIIDDMQDNPEISYIMGSGSTLQAIMDEIGVQNTLLGVDIVRDQQLIASDVSAKQLLAWVKSNPSKLVITAIGGQGHILGRGNQQISPEVVNTLGRDNIIIVATKTKLAALQGRPLISDSGDADLDAALSGLMPVITGFNDKVLYPLNYSSELQEETE